MFLSAVYIVFYTLHSKEKRRVEEKPKIGGGSGWFDLTIYNKKTTGT